VAFTGKRLVAFAGKLLVAFAGKCRNYLLKNIL